MKKTIWILVAAASWAAVPSKGQSVPAATHADAVGMKSFAAAPRLAMNAAPIRSLAPAANVVPEELDALEMWNAGAHPPMRNGFSRRLGDVLSVRIAPSEKSKATLSDAGGGRLTLSQNGAVWSGSVKVENAFRLRLHLENVKLPPNAVLWVYGDDDPAVAFDQVLLDPSNSIWTPSTEGTTIHLEVEVPFGSGEAAFDVSEVMELVDLNSRHISTNQNPFCLVDVQCVSQAAFPGVDAAKRAIAQLSYTKTEDRKGYVCTGGLINDTGPTYTPWLLTANHCIHDQAAASSLEAYWDYTSAGCGSGNLPPIGSLPRSNGATLIAHSTESDFSFLRLNSVPPGRWYLGWNPNPIPPGTKLFRVSHPVPNQTSYPQMFSTRTVDPSVGTCQGTPRPNFIYSTVWNSDVGGTYGGSSGSPVMLGNGQVVGQLLGVCPELGSDPEEGCDARNATIDGAFSSTFPNIRQYLNPPPCAYTLSPQSASFSAEPATGTVSVTASGCTGSWSASSSAPWITILSGASASGSATVTYSIAQNTSPPMRTGTLTIAGKSFTVSQAPPGECTTDTTLCLAGGRFTISATWRANDGSSGQGHAVSLTSDTGYFWFFGSNNIEVVIKVLDACGFNQRKWVFAGGLTNVNVMITVRDTKTGTVRTYTNPGNTAFQPIQDTGAFATCP